MFMLTPSSSGPSALTGTTVVLPRSTRGLKRFDRILTAMTEECGGEDVGRQGGWDAIAARGG